MSGAEWVEGPEWGPEPVRLAPATRFRLRGLGEVLVADPPDFIVDGVLPAAGLAVLYGAPGTFKSFLALSWALCVASGEPWMGRPVEVGQVVYIAAEGASGLGRRVEAWLSAHPGADPRDRIVVLSDQPNLLAGDDVEDLERAFAQLPVAPALVVVDTLARTLVGDENAAKDVGSFVRSVERLAAGGLGLVVHHSGHDASRERGSTALRGAADTMLRVTREGNRVSLTAAKALRDGPEFPGVVLRPTPEASSLVFVEDRAEVPSAPRGDRFDAAILSFAGEQGPVSKNAIAEGVTGRGAEIRKAVDRLVLAGRLLDTDGRFEVLPEDGEVPGKHHVPEGGPEGASRTPLPEGAGPGKPPTASPLPDGQDAGEVAW